MKVISRSRKSIVMIEEGLSLFSDSFTLSAQKCIIFKWRNTSMDKPMHWLGLTRCLKLSVVSKWYQLPRFSALKPLSGAFDKSD